MLGLVFENSGDCDFKFYMQFRIRKGAFLCILFFQATQPWGQFSLSGDNENSGSSDSKHKGKAWGSPPTARA
jgi:hypothetical protein